VLYHPTARAEADALPAQEGRALDNAVEKLASLGPTLPFPHSSKVMATRVVRCESCGRVPGEVRGDASMNASVTCS
jgi:hypothetical protein